MTRVKVCGVRSYEDAMAALDAGADALGFNFYPNSPRYVEPERARSIVDRLPALSVTVGVFVNEPETGVTATARRAGVGVLQLHGDESPEYCRGLHGWPVIKALRIGATELPADLGAFRVRAFLLDVRDDTHFGGTGRTCDWAVAERIKPCGPVILAGGLNAGNVRAAIAAAHPYAVDVCTGVESEPGRKDPHRLREFIHEVRRCE